jgi:hypothetical protein
MFYEEAGNLPQPFDLDVGSGARAAKTGKLGLFF